MSKQKVSEKDQLMVDATSAGNVSAIESSDHLPECLNDDDTYGLRGLCICDELRACEQRVLNAARKAVAGVGVRKDTSHDMRVQALAAIDALRGESNG